MTRNNVKVTRNKAKKLEYSADLSGGQELAAVLGVNPGDLVISTINQVVPTMRNIGLIYAGLGIILIIAAVALARSGGKQPLSHT